MRQGITDAVKHLLIINVVMFIGTLFIGNGAFYQWFAFVSIRGYRIKLSTRVLNI